MRKILRPTFGHLFNKNWVLAATLIICTVTMVFTSCTDNADNAVAEPEQPLSDKEMMMTLYGENKKITDGNYDKSLAVKCINGTFVGKRSGGIVAYKGIPFVVRSPWANCAGKHQWTMLRTRVCTRLIIMRKVPIRGRNPAKRPPFTFRARTACT